MLAGMVPDFIAGLGYTDDATMLLAALLTLAPHFDETHFTLPKDFFDSKPPTG
jgi:uncharacterized membrane protein YkvA (DUF1232 family)